MRVFHDSEKNQKENTNSTHGKPGAGCQKPEITRHLLSKLLFLGKKFLGLKSCHTAATRACDSLSVSFILNITSGKDTLHGGLCGSWNRDDVAVGVSLQLCAD